MPDVTLIPGDNRDSLRALIDQGVKVHSVVTDPPYGLVSIQKRFGKEGAAAARTEKNDGSFARLSGGFMGKAWDATGIERDPEFWKLIYDMLLPGGYVFAFSGSRTGHWQACAMEMAGFVMHPMHGWCFGSGFPKAHAADKAIDKHLGIEGHFNAAGNPVKRMIPGADQHRDGSWIKDNGREYQPGNYVPGSDEAAEWEGWAYGTQTQKPALEPIYLAQKPFSEKTGAANLLKHGVGALNIDGCRVPTEVGGRPLREVAAMREDVIYNGNSLSGRADGSLRSSKAVGSTDEGRHPSNLILDGSPEVVAMFPNTKSGKPGVMRKGTNDGACYGAESRAPGTLMTGFGDEGSAARFFHQFGPDTDPLFYHPKAGKADRAGSKHPTVKPIALMQYLIRHITPPGGIVLDPFAGSGTTAEAAIREGHEVILMESEPDYTEFLTERFCSPRDSQQISFQSIEKNEIGTLSLTHSPRSENILNGKLREGGTTGAAGAAMHTDLTDLLNDSFDLSDLLA